MAANDAKPKGLALRALTAAALALPGLAASREAAADSPEFSFDYQHYQEGERNLYDRSYDNLNLRPLSADSLSIGVFGEVADRFSLGINYAQDTWSGATPVATVPQAAIAYQVFSGASSPDSYPADRHHNPVDVDWDSYDGHSVDYSLDPRLVHVMASASPETRRQIDLKLAYEADNGAVSVGGGVSDEPDYRSLFANLGGRWDLNRKLTVLSASLSYTDSAIHADIAANQAADWGAYPHNIKYENGTPIFSADRRDIAANFGVTQILSPSALVEASITYVRSSGYLSNPYKATILAFDDPHQFIDSTGIRTVILKGTLEQRPTLRNQWTLDTRYVQYVEPLDASLHLDYRFYHDDWGIDAHTFGASWYQPLGGGWMAIPGVRYYTQSAAFFYQPYFLFNQAFPILLPRNPELPPNLDHRKIRIDNFSSDERLSGFGVLSGQFAVSKQINDTMRFEVGVEYARHAGSLKLGGNGEGAYADFAYHTLYAALTVNPALHAGDGGSDGGGGLGLGLDAGDDGHVPAGVTFGRMLNTAGDIAASYRDVRGFQNNGLRHGMHATDLQSVIDNSCGADITCKLVPTDLNTHLQELDIEYAATDWLTLVVAPRFVDTHVDLHVTGFFFPPAAPPPFGLPGPPETSTHSTGGIGDTTVAALVQLFDDDHAHIQAGLGVSIPTGSVDERLSGSHAFISYAQQLGSGTWDVQPSLTYIGEWGGLFWGAQASATTRPQKQNDSGYELGDAWQTTVWGGYDVFDWLSGSLRGVYTAEGGISGRFNPHRVPRIVGFKLIGTELVAIYANDLVPNSVFTPLESPANYGGQRWDVGIGLSAVVPDGQFAGNRFSLEWLQPVAERVRGYQLGRTGTLAFSWTIAM